MRKLFVGVLIAIFGVFALAGSTNVSVGWSIVKMKFVFTLDEKGIDVANSTYYKLWWNNSASESSGKVTAEFSWEFEGFKKYFALDSITFDGSLVNISYNNSGAAIDKYFAGAYWGGFGNDYISVNLKALSSLTFYYVDLLEETNPDATENTPAKSFFDDAVVVNFKQGFGALDLNAYVGFYDAEATQTDDTNAYEFVGVAYLTGKDALNGLKIEAAFANLGSGDSAYGVEVNYKFPLDLGAISLTVSPGLHYSENLTSIKFVNTCSWCGPYVYDAKKAWMSVSFSMKFDPVSVDVFTKPTYYIEGGNFTAYTSTTFGLDVKTLSAQATFKIWDAMDFSQGWRLETNADVDLSPIALNAKFWYNDAGVNAYSAQLTYTIEEGLKAKFFYGTLYDVDGDGSLDMNPDYPQWWLKVCYSL